MCFDKHHEIKCKTGRDLYTFLYKKSLVNFMCNAYKYYVVLFLLMFGISSYSQTPINISAQSGYTYIENFSDIANWAFNTSPTNGTFTVGTGSSAWKGIASTNSGIIPNSTIITTTSATFSSGTSGGVQKGTGTLMLLTTGSTDNTSSVAIDFYVNFTSLSAGTLSFDWSSVNNTTGDRKSSLKVYTSIDGSNFTELTGAAVSNITNNSVTSGNITNINLPANFNQASSAIIRFYLHNGSGGTTGSRPKISLDNVRVTGNLLANCTTPTSQPTSLNFTTIGSNQLQGNFTAASPAPDKYLILISSNNSLSSLPIDGSTYNVGDNIGDASVAANSSSTTFTISSLSSSATYYLYVFSSNTNCNGGPLYKTSSPLTGNATTTSGISSCIAPSSQPTSLNFSNITTSSIQGNFSLSSGTDEWLVVRKVSSSLSSNPLNGTIYNAGDALGGGVVVGRTTSGAFVANSLTINTTYYFFIFSVNSSNCSGGPIYLTTSPLSSNTSTLSSYSTTCTAPVYQPHNLVLSGDNKMITGSFSNVVDADSYLVIYSTSSSLSQQPQNNTNYTVGASLGNGIIVSTNSSNSFYLNGLNASTNYYFFIYAKNTSCNGGTKYNLTNPLTGSRTTTSTSAYNLYYGNLHAHSGYSDGNKDNPSYTPLIDYNYAKNSLGMDFLGISEHNHSGAGMSISNWPNGVSQSATATTSNFVALYGQEWGVISGGGHALIYGIDSLIGWEANNYQKFVAKSDYLGTPTTTGTTGLFRTLNLNGTGFATLAHPNNSDFDSLYYKTYYSTADSAIIGSAIESGVAFSTDTTYSDAPSSMGFLSYFTKLLAKGYHLGPLMDHDTHYTNFGRSNSNRLVVLSPSLTKANLLAALRNRRFYATQDIDTRVFFTINNQPMGSIISGNSAPIIYVNTYDSTSPSFVPTIKLMYGTPGSGVNAVQLTSTSSYTLSYTDNNLVNNGTYYYYLDITINGKRTITAPIWYTKNPCSFDDNNPIATWYGSSNTSISDANNWCSGVLPLTGSNIIISSSALNMPTIQSNETLIADNLTIEAGATLTINGILKVKSIVNNSGTVVASSGTIEFNGTQAQSTFAVQNNLISKLIINNAAGVTLQNTAKVSNTLTLNSGTFYTNDLLTLKSDATNTAQVTALGAGASIVGNVTVERHFPARRAWRFVTAPVRGSVGPITIQSAWQNNGGAATSNYGLELWHPNAGNGLTLAGGSGNIRKYIAGTGWSTLTNTNATNVTDVDGGSTTATNKAYTVFITGSYGSGTFAGGSSATTIQTIGKLQTGQQNMTISSTLDDYNLIGNPYASPIDLDLFKPDNSNINSVFYVWDPLLSSYGAYVAITRNGSNDFNYSVLNGKEYRHIQSGQAFFVRSNGMGSSLTFQESHKSSTNINNVFRQGNGQIEKLGINLSYKNTDNTLQLTDGTTALYDTSYSSQTTDEFDVLKFTNSNETFSIQRNGINMAMEARPLIDERDTIYFNMAGLRSLDYVFEFRPKNMINSGLQAFLVDVFNNTETSISLATPSTYNFNVNSNSATSASNRFKIIFKPILPLVTASINVKATEKINGILIEWKKENENNVDNYEVEKSTDGIHFSKVYTKQSTGQFNYEWLDQASLKGSNYYRIKVNYKNASSQFSNIIHIKTGNNKNNFITVINPVINKTLSIQFENTEEDVYGVVITNHLGQQVYFKNITHSGGSSTIQTNLNNIATGVYTLQVIASKKTTATYTEKILIQ